MDDSLGKCFHPACGRFITLGNSSTGTGSVVFSILEKVYRDFHQALLDLQSKEHRNAYHYCVTERGIHPCVVRDSMLGAVAAQYNVADLFRPCIADIESALRERDELKKQRGRSKKQVGPTLEEQLAFLLSAQEKLANCVNSRAGWLAFFYTDSTHRVVAVRFRKPYSKHIVFYKPTKIGGLFNHSLFTPYLSAELKDLNELLIVVEGEFNQLQLQSLSARIAEKHGSPPEAGYLFSGAVGGVHNADVETIRRLARTPVVCYDHDSSGAGFTLVETLRKRFSLTAFTTPTPDSDLDSFIRGFGNDITQGHEAVRALVRGRQLFTRPYEDLKAEIDGIRRLEGGKGGLKRFEVNRGAAEIIIRDFEDRGQLYHDGMSAYFFFAAEKHLVGIEREGQDLEVVLSQYGLMPGEEISRYLVDALRLQALQHGVRTQIHLFTHYDARANILYLFDFDSHIFRITANGVEQVDNGTDGVLFLRNPAWKPFTLLAPAPTRSAFDEMILSPMQFQEDNLTADDRRLLFLVWFYSLFFPERFPTRPILAVIGERGSGKTISLRKVGQLLFGPSFNVMQLTDDPKDFDAAVTRDPFAAVDNSDTKVPWLDDRLAVVATGGSVKRRELYTTNKLVEFPIRAFVGVTSRIPHFRREDVADRLLLFYVKRFEKFVPESKILSDLQARRDEILSEVVGHLHEIVHALGRETGQTYTTRFRMADFADFALRLAHAQGWGERMFSILDRLSGEQSSFTLEGEPVFELLDAWLTINSGKNVGREVTTSQLCSELATIAASKEIEFIYKGKTRSFAQRLRNIMSTLREYFDINDRPGRARTRYLSFQPRVSENESQWLEGEFDSTFSPQSPLDTDTFTSTFANPDRQLRLDGEVGEKTSPILVEEQ